MRAPGGRGMDAQAVAREREPRLAAPHGTPGGAVAPSRVAAPGLALYPCACTLRACRTQRQHAAGGARGAGVAPRARNIVGGSTLDDDSAAGGVVVRRRRAHASPRLD